MKIRVCGSGFTCAQKAPIERRPGCSNQSWEKVDVRDGAKIWPKRERRTKQSQNLPRGRRPPWGCGSPTWRLSRRSAPPPRGWQTGRLPAAPAMPSHVACVTRGRWDGHQGGGRALKYSGMSPRAPTEGLLLGIITPMISTGPLSPQKECQSVFVQAGTPQQHWVQLPHRCSPRANHRLQCRTRRGGHTVNRMRVSTARLG